MLLLLSADPLALSRVTSARNQEVVFGKKHVPPLNQCMIRKFRIMQPIVKSVTFLQALTYGGADVNTFELNSQDMSSGAQKKNKIFGKLSKRQIFGSALYSSIFLSYQ